MTTGLVSGAGRWWIVGDRQRVTVKHHSGLDSAADEAARSVILRDHVPDPDLGMTVGLPNQALEFLAELS